MNGYFLVAYTYPGEVRQSIPVAWNNPDYTIHMAGKCRTQGYRVAVADKDPLPGMNIRDVRSAPVSNFLEGGF